MVFINVFRQFGTSAIIFIFGLSVTFANYTRIEGLEGYRQPCQYEGEPVAVDHIDKLRCYSCICKNGFVECRNGYNCPPTMGCHMLVADKIEDGCCQMCKGCVYKGVKYRSHTEWTDPKDPCKVVRCEAGVITESDIRCHTPCSNPIHPEPGKCCPTCPECKINGQIATDDRDVISDDPCVKCRCTKRGMLCTKKACPVLQCNDKHQVHPPGECCPKCKGTRSLIQVKRACLIQNSFIKEGLMFNIDRCTNCSCANETSICKRNACPVLDCSPELQKTVPGSCCKTCAVPEEFRTQCFYKGKVYEDGQSWRMDACRSCKCHKGMPNCAMIRCNVTLPCGPGTKLVHTPGECCQKCQEVDGVCMVYGDPHYKTFDGKLYTFHGVGKFQLVSDCHNNTFSIRVANTFKLPKRTHRTIRTSTKRVAVKYNGIRINLQQRLRTKFNGRIIKFPFKEDRRVRMEKIGENVEVTLSNGVKIFWSGKSFLEVSVPAVFRNKLCGLCGNFNSNAQDDLRTKKGKIVRDNEIHYFGSSWCIGSKTNCTKQSRQTAHNYFSCNAPRTEPNYCKYLTDTNIIGSCNSVINSSKYYRTCKMDMCDCGNEKCYCQSLLAYTRECERLGVKLPNWQKQSLCFPSAPKRKKSSSREMSMFTSADIERFRQMVKNRTTKHRKPLLIQ